MSILDKNFRYHGVATHADPGAFARRMKARLREAQETVKAREAERAEKVRPIAGRQRRATT